MTDDTADLVFTHGTVLRDRSPVRTDVAVRGDRIVAVGTDEARRLRGTSTEVVDLAGGLLLPGFTDAHVHPLSGGLERSRCDLTQAAATRDAYLGAVRDYADANPDVPWILGSGWSLPVFGPAGPRADALDAIVPDRPVFLTNADGHGAWVNTRALELGGVTAETPDPSDGRIERDPDGRPSGTLHEGAMELVARLVPPPTFDEWLAALVDAQAYLHSLGITGWQDAIVEQGADGLDVADVYRDAAATGRLTARVVGALWWQRDRGAEQIPELRNRRERAGDGLFRATSVKIMQDGIVENYTAGMLEPYLDRHGHPTDNAGLSFVDPTALPEYVTALDADGFQVHFHAIGDRAVREALDAVAAARSVNGPNDLRHHIAHIEVIHPDDRRRFAELDVAANMQPLWATNEPQMVEMTLPFLGEVRSTCLYPFGDLAASGAAMCAGSDWPVSTPDPWPAIHVAVNRRLPGASEGDYGPLLPEQALDLATAVHAYTAGSARVNHLDDAGVIEVGRLADLVVTDRDPFAGPADEIGTTKVLQTYVGGRQVFAG